MNLASFFGTTLFQIAIFFQDKSSTEKKKAFELRSRIFYAGL